MQPIEQKINNTNLRQLSVSILLVVPAILFWGVVLTVTLFVFGAIIRGDDTCTVARVPIQGILTTTDSGLGRLLGLGAVTSADTIKTYINNAEENDQIQAILLDIDSPGGTPVAGDEIMTALQLATKPTVAVVRDRGTSAAYWAAVGADYIIAHPVSDVGSIGVTMSYLELASSTENSGTRWVDISSGDFKDAGNPERALSQAEEAHFQGQVDTVHTYMVERIAEARENLSLEEVEALADGRAYLGKDALELGLIDMIGGFGDALDYLESRGTSQNETLELCEPEMPSLGGFL
jgi:protease-4